jgi:hypothetical protein
MYVLESPAIRHSLRLFHPQQIMFSVQVIVLEVKMENNFSEDVFFCTRKVLQEVSLEV